MFSGGRPLHWPWDPLETLRRWRADRRVLLLHSGRFDPHWSRWSIMAPPVGAYRFVVPPHDGRSAMGRLLGRSQWIGPVAHRPVDRFTHKPFTDLNRILQRSDGLWIGYLGYDLGQWVEELGPAAAVDDRGWPIIELSYCPAYLVHDGLTGQWTAHGNWTHDDAPFDCVLPAPGPAPVTDHDVVAMGLRSGFGQASYERCVEQVKAYIAAGDVFQVNLAQRFTAALSRRRFAGHGSSAAGRGLFDRLARLSPAWYGAYLEMTGAPEDHWDDDAFDADGTPGRAILSTSPELFLQVNARRVVTRPIKGTRPATVDPAVLRDSAKDTAELNMIVDLMRNDLGRVCDYGSVRVVQARQIESHPTVHHGVATVEGRLHHSKGIIDLLRAAMPGGSVTGAPKVRAMQIIDQLEPVRRGPYCGCIGYLSRDRACLSIAIRTMLVDGLAQRVDFSVGGGIVADSQPSAEYEETLAKAAAMLSALGLVETVC